MRTKILRDQVKGRKWTLAIWIDDVGLVLVGRVMIGVRSGILFDL